MITAAAAAAIKPTILVYMRDTYLFSMSSAIVSVVRSAEETGIILEESIFHPQGGGQEG